MGEKSGGVFRMKEMVGFWWEEMGGEEGGLVGGGIGWGDDDAEEHGV